MSSDDEIDVPQADGSGGSAHGIEQYEVTHTKFICQSCGDTYVFVELGDWPRYCPTCGADNDSTGSERGHEDGGSA